MNSIKSKKSTVWDKLNWGFWFLFFSIGILNIIYIDEVLGTGYLLISFIYLPPIYNFLKRNYNIELWPFIKIIIAFLVLWFTLGVSDLFELFEKNVL